jgi:hypothetical protein
MKLNFQNNKARRTKAGYIILKQYVINDYPFLL